MTIIRTDPFIQRCSEISLLAGCLAGLQATMGATPENPATEVMDKSTPPSFAALAEANHCTAPPAGLVGWWGVDGNLIDLTSGKTASLRGGAAYVAGYVFRGLSFDGVDDYVEIGETSIPLPWTASVWVKRQDSLESSAVLLSSTTSALKIEQAGTQRKVGITQYDVADWAFNYSVPRDVWTHLCFVATPGTTRLYVNGLLEDSMSMTVALPRAQIGFRIAHQGLGPGAFKGALDEIMLFNRSLSADEILKIYGTGTSGLCKPPLFVQLSSPGNEHPSFNVTGPIGKPLDFFQSKDLKNWTRFLTLENPQGLVNLIVPPTNSAPTFFRALVRD